MQAVEKVQGIVWHFIFVWQISSLRRKNQCKTLGGQVLSRKMDNLHPFVKTGGFQQPENGMISPDAPNR
ncbi:hypothetical protein PDENDC454_15142 [Paenibacillus dendritiformis C454]|uniref:Uncharacterized protein n=1 Tax=Paenibacillus dendritiformis C454 TaxID=1131935 RepID=H3SHL5_9BACL|nr:hypothetical protein PDENDC454_15142 [Paenibacillus dendritiformis C454]